MGASFAGWWEGAGDGPATTDNEELPQAPLPTLAQEQERVARDRIKRAARDVLARRGFDATVDEIANACGVSTRTIFRHFGSHDRLIVDVVKDMLGSWAQGPVTRLPRPTDDLDGWLEGLAVTIHGLNAQFAGEAFWGIYASNCRDSPVLAELTTIRCAFRDRAVPYLARCAWGAAGRIGEPPEALVVAFATNLSVFTTRALMIDSERTPEEIGMLTAFALKVTLRSAVNGGDVRDAREIDGRSSSLG